MHTFSHPHAAFLALLTLGAAALAPSAHAQSVANGDFETGDFTGWTLSGNVNTGATADTFVFGNPHSGDYAAWLGPFGADGFLSQTIATTPGEAYTVTYWLAADAPSGTNNFTTSFGGQVLFTGSNLAPTDDNALSEDDYVRYSYTAVAADTASMLQFGFRNDPSRFRLDDVSVTRAAVPEPSSLVSVALLLALTGLCVAARRKRPAKITN